MTCGNVTVINITQGTLLWMKMYNAVDIWVVTASSQRNAVPTISLSPLSGSAIHNTILLPHADNEFHTQYLYNQMFSMIRNKEQSDNLICMKL